MKSIAEISVATIQPEDSLPTWVNDKTWRSRWNVEEALTGGGQGDVFRVRRFADGKIGFLKVIKAKTAPERRARFFREASAYDTLAIEGIPKLVESNAHLHSSPDIVPFIVTEFIVGKTLRSWRESMVSVSVDQAILITVRILDILQACHRQGCVHRDVKPDNIIVEQGVATSVWLLDFGISHHNLADVDFQTEDWQEVGNRFLRLPELSAGSRSKQDPRSDVSFAAGIFFYLLTGEHPDVLEDEDGRMPHQRKGAMMKLRQATSSQLGRILALFDDAFTPRIADRFATVHAMRERMDRIMHDQEPNMSLDAELAALRDVLDTSVNRRLMETTAKLNDVLQRVHTVFKGVSQSLGGTLGVGQSGWSVTSERGQNTLFLSRHGTADPVLSVTHEVVAAGEELVLRMSGETVYRTDFAEPVFGEKFTIVIRTWLTARLRDVLTNPNALPPEADLFREVRPQGSLSAAASEATRRRCAILAFVYDPTQPERGKLHWALNYFLENRRTRALMNETFVTALVPLAAISSISPVLDQQSMERSRWVLLDHDLRILEQHVIQANPETAETVIGDLAVRYPGTRD
ncbi:protein kinase [Duganella sp. sic0402]|uniref:serine/threonine protein kinase n=1 Tax=Duganella sp. sic0402 TaxID=2854786 RepID=UPI001C48A1C8|nr:protein kinase [Duganella sp. sic0402]MBV7539215.1 protein kinase [Duganella sp. sic0402]